MTELSIANANFARAAGSDLVLTTAELQDVLLSASMGKGELTREQFNSVADSLGMTVAERQSAWNQCTGGGTLNSVNVQFLIDTLTTNSGGQHEWTFDDFTRSFALTDGSNKYGQSSVDVTRSSTGNSTVQTSTNPSDTSSLTALSTFAHDAAKTLEEKSKTDKSFVDSHLAAVSIAAITDVLSLKGSPIGSELLHALQNQISLLLSGGKEVALASGAELIANGLQKLGIEVATKAVGQVVGSAATLLGYAYAAYKVVMAGFDIADIAQRKDITDAQKAISSMNTLRDTLFDLGIAAVATPAGWVLLAVAGALNVVASSTDIIENGGNGANISQLWGGHLGTLLQDAFFPTEPPKIALSTYIPEAWDKHGSLPTSDHWLTLPKGDNSPILGVLDERGVNQLFSKSPGAGTAEVALAGPLGAFLFGDKKNDQQIHLTTQTDFGVAQIYINGIPAGINSETVQELADGYSKTLAGVRDLDKQFAKAINEADANNHQDLRTMTYFRDHTNESDKDIVVGGQEMANQNGDGMMLDDRYTQILARLGQSGTEAGKSASAWFKLINEKLSGAPGSSEIIIRQLIDNPTLLKMPESVSQRIMNTIQPGDSGSVFFQLTNTVFTYQVLKAKNPTFSEDKLLSATFDQLKVQEDYGFVAKPAYLPSEKNGSVNALSRVPAEVVDFATLIQKSGEANNRGEIKLLGQSSWNTSQYEIKVNGVTNSYAFHRGATLESSYFEQKSNVEVHPSDAAALARAQASGAPKPTIQPERMGDMERVKQPSSPPGLLVSACISALRQEGQDVTYLGESKWDGHYELMVNGKQNAYRFLNNAFIQESNTKLAAKLAA